MKLIIISLLAILVSGCSGMGMSSGMGGMSSDGSSGNSSAMHDQTKSMMYSGGGN